MHDRVVSFIRSLFRAPNGAIPLNAPHYSDREHAFISDALDKHLLNTSGTPQTTKLEEIAANISNARYAVAVDSLTHAYQMCLISSGIAPGDEIVTQPILNDALLHAFIHLQVTPVFLDVDRDTLGLSPESLEAFLKNHATFHKGHSWNRNTGKRIAACLPMHTFGIPVRIDEIAEICSNWGVCLIEGMPDGLGTRWNNKPVGTFGKSAVASFGDLQPLLGSSGAIILSNDTRTARDCRELMMAGRLPRPWEYTGYHFSDTFRMPNLNAAALCALLENLDDLLRNKRNLAMEYAVFFAKTRFRFVSDPKNGLANFWLNTVIVQDKEMRDEFLKATADEGIATCGLRTLAPRLPIMSQCQHDALYEARWLADRVVNIPSSYRPFASRQRASARSSGSAPA